MILSFYFILFQPGRVATIVEDKEVDIISNNIILLLL